MKAAKRNEIMLFLLECLKSGIEHDSSFKVSPNRDAVKAVQECARLARAWDELRKWARHQRCTDMTCAKMDELVPPEPLDKLERFAGWLHKVAPCLHPVDEDLILDKIKELQDEDS